MASRQVSSIGAKESSAAASRRFYQQLHVKEEILDRNEPPFSSATPCTAFTRA